MLAPPSLRDPDDLPVLTCAIAAGVDAISTGDKGLLSPKSFEAAILIMDEMGAPGEGTRPTRWRYCGGGRPGALTRRWVTAAFEGTSRRGMASARGLACAFGRPAPDTIGEGRLCQMAARCLVVWH